MRRMLFYHRRGMSLVELLVVVAILGLLAVSVLPTVASTTESRRTREAARVASSFIASAQTRSLGRREWSGFRVVPAGAGNVAVDLTLVDVPPPYRGDVVPTEVQLLTPVTGMTTGTATVTSGEISAAMGSTIAAGDSVRFGGRDPWYSVATVNATVPTVSPGSITFTRRTAMGQADTNTPWPPATQPLAFEIAANPVAYGSGITLGESRVVDIIWSGCDVSGSFSQFAAGAITVLYDGTGRLRRVVQGVGSPTDNPGAVFFLIGRADRAGELDPSTFSPNDDTTGCNWQYADSFWVMINPATGTVHQAACEAGHATPKESQFYVRSYLSTGGGG